MKKERFYIEELNNRSTITNMRIDDVIIEKQSSFQKIQIFYNKRYGKFLVLDDIQFAEYDEYKYHEPLVHIAMLLHPNPKKIFILGGGDGLAAREVLKHDSVESVHLVDIDKDMIELSKKYFGELNRHSLKNPKVHVVVDDVRNFVKHTDEKFDVAIMDLPDISSNTEFLYADKQIKEYKHVLLKSGIFVTHAQTISPKNDIPAFPVYWLMKQNFKYVYLYKGDFVPSFFDTWYYVIGSDTIDVAKLNLRDTPELWDKLKLYENKEELIRAIKLLKDARKMMKDAEEYVKKNGFNIKDKNKFNFEQEVTKVYTKYE